MFTNHRIVGLWLLVLTCSALPRFVWAQEGSRATVKAAIKAHGGEKKIATTLTGSLHAKAKHSIPPNLEATVAWEETFELPRRYKRLINGCINGKNFSLEYAITEGSGWIRQNDGPPMEWKGQKLPLSQSWNAMLAMLPPLLDDRVKLEPAGKERVGDRDLIGVKISSEQYILFFERKTGLLAKSKGKIQHPLSRKEVDGEAVFSDYKDVSGVRYPMRIATYSEGKKIIELEITKIEFLKKIEDRLFEKP